MSAVTGPMMMGPRGVVMVLVMDLVGSMISTGADEPETTRPEDGNQRRADGRGGARAGIDETAVNIAADDDGRAGFRDCRRGWLGSRRADQRDAAGIDEGTARGVRAGKAGRRPVSLAQEWMPPRVCDTGHAGAHAGNRRGDDQEIAVQRAVQVHDDGVGGRGIDAGILNDAAAAQKDIAGDLGALDQLEGGRVVALDDQRRSSGRRWSRRSRY